jgi:hypothetical protein
MNVKRILSRLRLDKIAGVDRPCQEGAVAVLIKRADDDGLSNGAQMAKAFCTALSKGGLYIGPTDESDSAQNFDEVLQEQELTRQFWDDYYNATNALQEALTSAIKDESVTDKQAAFQESIKQFADHMEQILPGDIGKSLAAGIAASVGQPGTTTGEVMTPELKKALGLPETATDADVMKAITDKNEAVTKAEGDLVKANAELEKAKAKPAVDPDGDDDMAKALASGDAFQTPEGTIITKKALGNEAAFTLAKSQNARLVKAEADLAKSQDADLERSFAKRAEDLGYGAEFGPTLRKAYSGDATAQTELEKRIQGLQKQVEEGELFKNFGHSAPAADSAVAEFMAKVEEVKKADPKLTDAQAYSKAYTDRSNAPIVKRMKAETAVQAN